MSDLEDLDVFDDPERREELEQLWLEAMEARHAGRDGEARGLFEELLRLEPRLAEPRLELAHMHVEAGELEEAEEHARLAVTTLSSGGQWIDDLPGEQIESFARNLLGEILFRRAEAVGPDGDAERFDVLWEEAARLFARAAALDPGNDEARRNAFHVRTRRGGRG